MYKTGNGSIRQRAKWEIEDGDIVITRAAVPGLGQQGAAADRGADERPRSCRWSRTCATSRISENPTRIVIVPRSNRVDLDELMTHLFATTDLERSYRVNMNMIGLDGRPRLYNLRDLLAEWLEFRIETVRRRLQHRYDQVNARLHILDG